MNIVRSAAAFGLLITALISGPAMAQPNLGTFARDPMAPLAGAFTESQARSACRTEMRGARSESRANRSKRMEVCMRGKMNGN